MVVGEPKAICIKSAKPCFTKGKVYVGRWDNTVVTSAVRLLVEDDEGHKSHIIAEGDLKEDKWFNEHFKIVE